jgi:hypothetical protein
VALLYDPFHEIFCVAAMLSPNRHGAAGATVTVIERTTIVETSKEFETDLRPSAFVRRREITNAGIAAAELDGGILAFSGLTWPIEAHGPRPGWMDSPPVGFEPLDAAQIRVSLEGIEPQASGDASSCR